MATLSEDIGNEVGIAELFQAGSRRAAVNLFENLTKNRLSDFIWLSISSHCVVKVDYLATLPRVCETFDIKFQNYI